MFLKAVFGIASTELATYQQYTGRQQVEAGGVREAFAIVGRHGGKSRIVAVAAAFIACFMEFRDYLVPGENGTVLILARDRDQARVVFNYVRVILRSTPILRQTRRHMEIRRNLAA